MISRSNNMWDFRKYMGGRGNEGLALMKSVMLLDSLVQH